MLVITGGQRSGTSALSKMFLDSGYDLGTTWWDEVVEGGLENPTLCSFYSDYIGDPNFPFEGMVRADRYRATDFGDLKLPVAKFSYLTMVPAFIPIWRKFRPTWMGDQFIIMNRSSFDVLASKARHYGVFNRDSVLLKQSIDELELSKARSVHMLLEFGYSVAYQQFDMLASAACLNYTLKILGSKIRLEQDIVSSVYDASKIHF